MAQSLIQKSRKALTEGAISRNRQPTPDTDYEPPDIMDEDIQGPQKIWTNADTEKYLPQDIMDEELPPIPDIMDEEPPAAPLSNYGRNVGYPEADTYAEGFARSVLSEDPGKEITEGLRDYGIGAGKAALGFLKDVALTTARLSGPVGSVLTGESFPEQMAGLGQTAKTIGKLGLASTGPLGEAITGTNPVEQVIPGFGKTVAQAGVHPQEFREMMGGITGAPILTEGIVRGIPPTVRAAGYPTEFAGRIMREHAPVSGTLPRILEPRIARTVERGVGRGIESLGKGMKNFGRKVKVVNGQVVEGEVIDGEFVESPFQEGQSVSPDVNTTYRRPVEIGPAPINPDGSYTPDVMRRDMYDPPMDSPDLPLQNPVPGIVDDLPLQDGMDLSQGLTSEALSTIDPSVPAVTKPRPVPGSPSYFRDSIAEINALPESTDYPMPQGGNWKFPPTAEPQGTQGLQGFPEPEVPTQVPAPVTEGPLQEGTDIKPKVRLNPDGTYTNLATGEVFDSKGKKAETGLKTITRDTTQPNEVRLSMKPPTTVEGIIAAVPKSGNVQFDNALTRLQDLNQRYEAGNLSIAEVRDRQKLMGLVQNHPDMPTNLAQALNTATLPKAPQLSNEVMAEQPLTEGSSLPEPTPSSIPPEGLTQEYMDRGWANAFQNTKGVIPQGMAQTTIDKAKNVTPFAEPNQNVVAGSPFAHLFDEGLAEGQELTTGGMVEPIATNKNTGQPVYPDEVGTHKLGDKRVLEPDEPNRGTRFKDHHHETKDIIQEMKNNPNSAYYREDADQSDIQAEIEEIRRGRHAKDVTPKQGTIEEPKNVTPKKYTIENAPPNQRARIFRGAHDAVDVFFPDTESRENFGAASVNYRNSTPASLQRFADAEKRIADKYEIPAQAARNALMGYHTYVKDTAKAQPKYSDKEISTDVMTFKEWFESDDPNQINFARSEKGGIKAGSNVKRSIKEVTTGYSNDLQAIMIREAMQNALDAVRENTDSGTVDLEITKNGFTMTDNGKGMTREQLETVFSDVYSSGKEDDPNSTGGKGIGKATYMFGGNKFKVVTTVMENGHRMQHSFEGTPEELEEHVDVHSKKVAHSVPLGTTITTEFVDDKKEVYKPSQMLKNIMRFSRELKPQVTFNLEHMYGGGMMGRNTQTFQDFSKDEFLEETKIEGHGVKIVVPHDVDKDARKGFYIEVLNNGMYQYSEYHYMGDTKIENMPDHVIVDIRPNAKEGTVEYPFPTQRESLKESIKEKIDELIKIRLVNPAAQKRKNRLQELYDGMPTVRNDTVREAVIFDPGNRMTRDETIAFVNNSTINHLLSTVDGFIEEILQAVGEDPWSDRLEKIGIVLDPGMHGVHIPNPDTGKSAILINPFINIERGMDVEEAALEMAVTILHEVAHIGNNIPYASGKLPKSELNDPRIGRYLMSLIKEIQHHGGTDMGHGIGFIKRLGYVYEKLKVETAFGAVDDIQRIYQGNSAGGYSRDIQEALQIYTASRGRDAVTEDLLSGTGVKQKSEGSGKGNIPRASKGYADGVSRGTSRLEGFPEPDLVTGQELAPRHPLDIRGETGVVRGSVDVEKQQVRNQEFARNVVEEQEREDREPLDGRHILNNIGWSALSLDRRQLANKRLSGAAPRDEFDDRFDWMFESDDRSGDAVRPAETPHWYVDTPAEDHAPVPFDPYEDELNDEIDITSDLDEDDPPDYYDNIRKLRAETGEPNPPVTFGLQDLGVINKQAKLTGPKYKKLYEVSKSQVELERTLSRSPESRKTAREIWDGWGKRYIENTPDGPPGLSIEDNSSQWGSIKNYNVIYRGPDGKAVAVAEVTENTNGARTVGILAARSDKGMLSGKAAVMVGKALIAMNAGEASGTISPFTANLILKSDKLVKD